MKATIDEAFVCGRIERVRGDNKMKIRIQTVTKDLESMVIQHMYDHFIEREPLCRHTDLVHDVVGLQDIFTGWSQCMRDGVSLVALLENEDGTLTQPPMIVGANVLYIYKKGDIASHGVADSYNKVLDAVVEITKVGDICNRYNVDRYMGAFGLSVHCNYHKMGLGKEIIRAREAVCRHFGITLACTVFSAEVSRHIASSLGYENVYEMKYKDLTLNGERILSDLDGRMTLMVVQF